MRRSARAFAGDDERDLLTVGLSATEEAKQRFMRLPLRHAVQIDAGLDRLVAARHTLLEPAFERRERRRFYRRWRLRWRLLPRRRARLVWRFALAGGGERLWRRPAGPQRRDRAHEGAPQRLFLFAQRTAPTHFFCRVLVFAFGVGVTGCGWSGAGSTAVGSSIVLSRLRLNALGRSRGNGISRPASTGSSARGMSITKSPGFLMRPAMRAASAPAPK